MHSLIKKFGSLTSRERNQILLISGLSLVAIYTAVAALMWQQMFDATRLANRLQNRYELHVGDYQIPDIRPGLTQKALLKIEQTLSNQESKLRLFGEDLLPLDSPEPQEQTKLHISQLAQSTGLNIVRFDTNSSKAKSLNSNLTGEELKEFFIKRPVFSISANGDYYSFIAFIEHLSELPYIAFIPNLHIQSGEKSLLSFNFDLQM